MSVCSICIEKFNKSSNKKIECKTCKDDEETKVCTSCAKKYILENCKEAKCMVCNIECDKEFLFDYFTKKFINSDFKNHQEEYLYEKVILLNDSNLTNILYSSNIIPIHNSLSNHPIKKIYIYNNKEDLNNLKFQLFINQQYTSSDALDHQYLSKIPFLNKKDYTKKSLSNKS